MARREECYDYLYLFEMWKSFTPFYHYSRAEMTNLLTIFVVQPHVRVAVEALTDKRYKE